MEHAAKKWKDNNNNTTILIDYVWRLFLSFTKQQSLCNVIDITGLDRERFIWI